MGGQVGNSKTIEEQEIFEAQMISQCCDKIIEGIKCGANHNRAIWELSQNARDVSDINGCEIKISLVGDNLTFAHNGKPFDYKSLISLILQVSSKEKVDTHNEFAGRFGTGFMEAQAFGKKIYLGGSYKVEIDKYVDIEPVCIDREFDISDREAIKQKLSENVEEVSLLRKNKSYSEPKKFTEFKFKLTKDTKKIAKDALDNAYEIIPFVLVLNNRIKKYTIVVEDKEYVFTRKGDATNVNADGLKVMTIKKTWNEKVEEKNCYFLELPEDNGIVILPFENQTEGADFSKYSKLFCYFPLLGTENFGFSFIFNSKKFEPEQSRNRIQLPSYNDDTKQLADINVELLKQMQQQTLDYLSKHIAEMSDVIKFADINFHYVSDEGKNEPLRDFFDKYHRDWVERFKEFEIVEEDDDNKYSVSDTDNIRFFDKEITDFLSKNKEYLSSVYYFAQRVSNLPKEEEILKWSEIVQNWGCVDGQLITIDGICSEINNDEEYTEGYLHDFLTVVKLLKKEELFKEYTLIPNREFELHKKSDLRRANSSISPVLYNVAKAISSEITSKFVNDEYIDIIDLDQYSRDDLRKDINDTIGKKRNKSTLFDDEFEKALFKYCSVFYNGSTDSIRLKLMPVFAECLGYEFIEQRIFPKSTEEGDLFETPFYNLCEQVCYKISKWEKVLNGTNNFNILLKFFGEIKNANKIKDIVVKYSVFPNMKGNLCKIDKLYMLEEYDNALLDIYNEATGKDMRDIVVNNEFKTIWEFNKYELINIGKEIEDSLNVKNANEVTNVTLKIIENLDNGRWEGVFPYIEGHKAELFFKKVQGKNKDNVYKIMKVDDSECLQLLAELSSNTNRLIRARELLEAEDQKKAESQYKKQLGGHIEECLQREIAKEIDGFEIKVEPTVENIQDGQDLIVFSNGEAVYYIEVKSKWSFEKDPYAHMSKNQMSKSKEKNDCYALCCVNLSDFKGEDKYNLGIDKIIENTSVHLQIGDTFGEFLTAMNEVDGHLEKNDISMSVDYNCNIPKSKFTSGQPFEELIEDIKKRIKNNL